MWAGLVWFKIGTGTFGFLKLLGNYRVSKQLKISRVVLSSMESVSQSVSQSVVCTERCHVNCISVRLN
jgi:hypothetical protein